MEFPTISNLFSTKPPAPATPPAPSVTPQTPNNASSDASNQSGVQNLGGQPNEGQMNGTNQTPANPLDAYQKMFDNAAKAGDGTSAPSFKLDPKVLAEVSSSMDFTKSIPQELMQKALTGDVASLMEVIKQSNQQAYRASLEHTSTLTDSFLNQRQTFEQSRVDKGVRNQLTQSELAQTPNYDHPVVKAELNRVAEQFARANPDASPQSIAKAAQQYLTDLHAAMNPTTKQGGDSSIGDGQMDWSKYLSKT
jgi:hypothetical protein